MQNILLDRFERVFLCLAPLLDHGLVLFGLHLELLGRRDLFLCVVDYLLAVGTHGFEHVFPPQLLDVQPFVHIYFHSGVRDD